MSPDIPEMAAWPWAMALVNYVPGFAGGHGRFAALQ
jgi:hypothetical protein